MVSSEEKNKILKAFSSFQNKEAVYLKDKD